MSDTARLLHSLHAADAPVVRPNAWDGGGLPRPELLGAVRRILRVARIPLTAEIEVPYPDMLRLCTAAA